MYESNPVSTRTYRRSLVEQLEAEGLQAFDGEFDIFDINSYLLHAFTPVRNEPSNGAAIIQWFEKFYPGSA